MNRTKKFFLNSLSTAIYQIVVMIVGFITPRILLSVYGSEINGLVSSITQFITYFSLVEAGIAGAAVYSLYKPLAEENHKEISVIVSSAKKFYLKAGLVFTILVIILAILYPMFVSVSDMSTFAVGILVFALGAKGFFEFFTLAKYRVLLTADQKTYIISNASTIYIIVQTIIIVILANLHVNVVIVYSLSIIALFVRTLILMVYTRHHYKYLKYNEPVNEKVLDKRWDALFLQIVQTVQTGAPVVLATIFTNLKSVSIYTIYNMVLNGINGVLSIFVNGLYASFGDLIARKETEKLKSVYREYEFSYYFIIAFIYSVAMVMLMPFIQLYTRGINDANYMQPLIGFLFVLNGILYSIKNPQGMLVMSAGLYKETRVQCSIQALIIIIGGIILAPTLGIAGILIANCLSNLYRTIDMGIFIPKNVTKLKPSDSFKRMLLVGFMIILGVLPFIFIDLPINSYLDWIIMAIIVSAYVLLVVSGLSLIFERQQLKTVFARIKGLFGGILEKFHISKKILISIMSISIVVVITIVGIWGYNKITNSDNIEENFALLEELNNFNSYLVENDLSNYTLKITSDKNHNKLKLTVNNKNLYDGNFDNGFINGNTINLIDSSNTIYKTTKWISIPDNTQFLTLSGNGINRAKWQYMLNTGEIVEYYEETYYRSKDSIWGNKSSSTIELPDNAIAVRVYYAKTSDETTVSLGEEVQIEIGGINTQFIENTKMVIELPEMQKNETITYNGTDWILVKKDGTNEKLDLPQIDIEKKTLLQLDNRFDSRIDLEYTEQEVVEDGIYGIKWDEDNESPLCERVGDSKNFDTSYFIDDKQITPYNNDFDNIYPWSEIKLCCIVYDDNNNREVIYQEDSRFDNEVSSGGQVMVEIPKFYFKREKEGSTQFLYVSKNKYEGFELDPSFLTEDGELDYIYIAAYQSAILNNKLISSTDTYPLINMSLAEIKEAMPEGYSEMDLLSVFTLQKLFMVETAVLDSQSLFMGNTNLVYFDHSNSGNTAALKSENMSNTITVKKTISNMKFKVGDAVTLVNNREDWFNFKNEIDKSQRQITKIVNKDETIEITFSGDKVDIKEGITTIIHIPRKNGQTDSINYHTGIANKNDGLNSFKYRYIENLYGNVYILLNDNAYIQNKELYVDFYNNGNYQKIDTFDISEQMAMIEINSKGSEMSIQNIGLDNKNQWVMLPNKIGASTTTYFSDFFYLSTQQDKRYLFAYGGTWDNASSAGIFNLRAILTIEDQGLEKNPYGSRMILK